MTTISSLAGKKVPSEQLVNIPQLITAYYTEIPDAHIPAQRVAFGTSGHRGSSLDASFNEAHILAVTQAICLYRKEHKIDGPLFLGMDTHALSFPALVTALEVLAANNVEVRLSKNDLYTPTPALSHAILVYNRNRPINKADGIIITPSHNPPGDGGFKYNPPHGGPAETAVTKWIEKKANEFLESGVEHIKRMPYEKALHASTTAEYDYRENYVKDLIHVIDMDVIRHAGITLGVDPLGGAGVHYWQQIADYYRIKLEIVNKDVDPTFRFMSLDWDGKIRMDPSSCYAMESLISLKERFDIAFACDTDHDRHGIVTKTAGLLPTNHYLTAAVFYLFQHRPQWPKKAGVGKTLVSSQMIDRVTAKLNRSLYEVPAGFKWFANGLLDSSLGIGCEESAGASFIRVDGTVWTTDKDGIILALLSAEMTAKMGKDPAQIYQDLTMQFGNPTYMRIDAPATPEEKEKIKKLSPEQIHSKELAGEKILSILTRAPGNDAPIDGLKVSTENGWFAARPSGTESIYKIYAESFLDQNHLNKILEEAQHIVSCCF